MRSCFTFFLPGIAINLNMSFLLQCARERQSRSIIIFFPQRETWLLCFLNVAGYAARSCRSARCSAAALSGQTTGAYTRSSNDKLFESIVNEGKPSPLFTVFRSPPLSFSFLCFAHLPYHWVFLFILLSYLLFSSFHPLTFLFLLFTPCFILFSSWLII